MTESLSLAESDPLVHGFLILAFLVHAIFMNLVVGGTVVTVMTDAIGMVTARAHYQQLASTLADWLPGFMGVAVVLGMFPLVLMQIVYGPIFSPSMNLLQDMWVLALSAAIMGFGGIYAYKHWRDTLIAQPARLLATGLVSVLMFLIVAFVFVVASVLMLDPNKWAEIDHTGLGAVMSLPTLVPRYGHLVLASVAGTGIFLVCYGLFVGSSRQALTGIEPKERYATWVIRYGVAWTLGGTLPQIVVGPWLLLALPDFVRTDLVSGQHFGSIAFFVGLTTALLSVVLLNAALMVPHVKGLAIGGIASLGVTIGLMVIVRHAVRVSWLSQFDEKAGISAQGQWEVLGVVCTMLLMGLVFAVLLMRSHKKRQSYS